MLVSRTEEFYALFFDDANDMNDHVWIGEGVSVENLRVCRVVSDYVIRYAIGYADKVYRGDHKPNPLATKEALIELIGAEVDTAIDGGADWGVVQLVVRGEVYASASFEHDPGLYDILLGYCCDQCELCC
jgi:hypothetical protein